MKALIEVRSNTKYGRGLFATRKIKKGEIVERSPVVVMSQFASVNHTVLNTYVFEWQRSDRALALGLGSLFNHSSKRPNVSYNPFFQLQELVFVATRDIRRGEQLFINYGYDPKRGIEVTERHLLHTLKAKFDRIDNPPDERRGLGIEKFDELIKDKEKAYETAEVRSK